MKHTLLANKLLKAWDMLIFQLMIQKKLNFLLVIMKTTNF